MFTNEQIRADGLSINLTENAIQVMTTRYLARDVNGEIAELPTQLFRRVANAVAAGSDKYPAGPSSAVLANDFYDIMVNRNFMPNTPTLCNAGRELAALSACFVLPLNDSIEEIFDCVKSVARIQRAGGGTGFCLDNLRPTGDFIKSSGGTTSGPIPFWKVLAETTNAIQQGASRRGANMMCCNVTHPDILKFLFAKQDLSQFQNYNISVKFTDEWMDARKANGAAPHAVTNKRTGKAYVLPKTLAIATYQLQDLVPADKYDGVVPVWSMNDIFNTVIKNAWKTGEPGALFISKVSAANPTPNIGDMEATNPCGEQPLLPNEACNLGSINVRSCITQRDGKKEMDWDKLRRVIHTAMRFLENVVEINKYATPEIDKLCRENRKVGLGVMSEADALFALGIPYNSEEGIGFGRKLMKFINDEAHNMSEQLAEERGVFANWKGSRWETEWGNRKQRNACSTTVAPTGTISIIAGCSGGLEPIFSLAFQRKVMKDHLGVAKVMNEVNEEFKAVAEANSYWGMTEDALIGELLKTGTLAGIAAVPDKVKKVFVGARDISPEWHTKMQAAHQLHCDSAISKTINLPENATEDDVRTVYEMAYDLGCKGVTVYRDNCRACQPMALADKPTPATPKPEVPTVLTQVKTAQVCPAVRIRQNTPHGHMHVNIVVNTKENKELEVFAQLGKGGETAGADLEGICRMASLFLRSGGTIKDVIKQLSGIGTVHGIPTKDGQVSSLPDALSKALRKYVVAKEKHGLPAILLGEADVENTDIKENVTVKTVTYKLQCPQCETGELAKQEGCQKCHSCGYSKC